MSEPYAMLEASCSPAQEQMKKSFVLCGASCK